MPFRISRGVAAGVLVASSLFAGSAEAQDRRVITGVVMDVDDRPIPSARLQSDGVTAVADDSGRFRIAVPIRDRTVFDVTRLGFRPTKFSLAVGGDTSVSILMLATVRQLDAVDVKAPETNLLDRTGFAQRMAERQKGTGSGYFITAAEIERRNPNRISVIFEDLPGVTVCRQGVSKTCGLKGTHLVSKRSGTGIVFVPCTMTVYLDGVRQNRLVDPGSDTTNIDWVIEAADVSGIEYYPSGNRAPPQFQALNGSCGVVVLWSKRG